MTLSPGREYVLYALLDRLCAVGLVESNAHLHEWS